MTQARFALGAILLLLSAHSVIASLGNDSYAAGFTEFDGSTYFTARNAEQDLCLWRTNGTPSGTELVRPLAADSFAGAIKAAGGQLFFTSGKSLWRVDGTVSGSVEIMAYPGATFVRYLRDYRGSLVFAVEYQDSVELWRSDGTVNGTTVVGRFLHPNFFFDLTDAGGRLYFIAWDENRMSRAVWVSDGTFGGTRTLAGGNFNALVAVNNRVIFSGEGGTWSSDGEVTGPILDIEFNASTEGGPVIYIVRAGSIWRTDGTVAGTWLLKELPPSHGVDRITAAGQKLFFFVSPPYIDSLTRYELWASDGTPAGTLPVKSFVKTDQEAMVNVAFGAKLVFAADDGTTGNEPWISDGTPEGTTLLRDIKPGGRWTAITGELMFLEFGSQPRAFAISRGRIFFNASDEQRGREPWISDGTTEGTDLLLNIHEEGTITGTVRSSSGQALQGVQLQATTGMYGSLIAVESDATGAFRMEGLRDGSYYLSTSNTAQLLNQVYPGRECAPCPGSEGSPIQVSAGVTVSGADFSLRRGGSIEGTITDGKTGAPLTPVTVVINRFDGTFITVGRSDAAGRYVSADGLPPGIYFAYTLTELPYGNQVYAGIRYPAGSTPATGTPIVIEGSQQVGKVDFRLLPWARIGGRVTEGGTGKPLQNIHIVVRTVRGDYHRTVAVSDRGGYFTAGLPDGTYYLFTEGSLSRGYMDQLYSGVDCPSFLNGCSIHDATLIDAVPGEVQNGRDFALKKDSRERQRGASPH
jgi:ELWxxDGT repeat protein